MKTVVAFLCAALCVTATCHAEKIFDPKRDPIVDLLAAEKTAKVEGKYILLDAGGDWCVWCKILEKTLHTTPALDAAMRKSFVIVHVNWSPEQENKEFFARYPAAPGYPHFFVLAANGELLKSVGTEEFEADHKEAHGYNVDRLINFASSWTPKQPQPN